MDKPKCSKCSERDAFAKGLCTRCYGAQWREERKAERAGVITGDVIEGEIIEPSTALAVIPDTHLVATSPEEMKAAQGDLRAWLEQRLTILERDILEANMALNEARKNGWATGALLSARNRAVDDETFYNKILAAVEAGHTIIPDFPISIFAVRRHEPVKREVQTFHGVTHGRQTYLGQPTEPDCAPAGAGEYRNPQPEVTTNVYENRLATPDNKESRYHTAVKRTGQPAGPIMFPHFSARSPVMRATAKAMKDKVFDQVGVCSPTTAVAGGRAVRQGARAGDPLIIGQVVRKKIGSQQKVVSFIIAWHLNLEEM